MSTLRSRKDHSQPVVSAATIADVERRRPRRRKASGSTSILAFAIGTALIILGTTMLQQGILQNQEISESRIRQPQPAKQTSSSSLFRKSSRQVEKRNLKGEVVHKSITAVRKEDLIGLVDPEVLNDPNLDKITYEEAILGREELVDILHDAGVKDLDVTALLSLPKWSKVRELYGDGPVVIGLDSCKKFRETSRLDDASIGIAGMFNTGTYRGTISCFALEQSSHLSIFA